MGLNIKAYKNSYLVDNIIDDEVEDVDYIKMDNKLPVHNERLSPFELGSCYEGKLLHDTSFNVAYSFIKYFRKWLVEVAGFSEEYYYNNDGNDLFGNKLPFRDFIFFHDSFGVIGTDSCKVLLQDFYDYESVMEIIPGPSGSGFMREQYRIMIKLLEWASEDGFIIFG